MDNREKLFVDKVIARTLELLETDPERLFEIIKQIDAMKNEKA